MNDFAWNAVRTDNSFQEERYIGDLASKFCFSLRRNPEIHRDVSKQLKEDLFECTEVKAGVTVQDFPKLRSQDRFQRRSCGTDHWDFLPLRSRRFFSADAFNSDPKDRDLQSTDVEVFKCLSQHQVQRQLCGTDRCSPATTLAETDRCGVCYLKCRSSKV